MESTFNSTNLINKNSFIQQNDNRYSYKQVKIWCHLCCKQYSRLIESNIQQELYCESCNSPCEIIDNPNDHPQHYNVYTNTERSQQIPKPTAEHRQQQESQSSNQNYHQSNQRRIPLFINHTIIFNTSPSIFGDFGQNLFGNFFNSNQEQRQNDFLDRLIEQFLANDPNNYGPQPAEKTKVENLKCNILNKDCQECCSICQENYKMGQKMTELPCKHNYHQECISEWLGRHNSCPICRKSI